MQIDLITNSARFFVNASTSSVHTYNFIIRTCSIDIKGICTTDGIFVIIRRVSVCPKKLNLETVITSKVPFSWYLFHSNPSLYYIVSPKDRKVINRGEY